MPLLIDLTGQRFERLTVVKHAGQAPAGAMLWLCLCDCGKEKIIYGSNLKIGHTKSCGCLSVEQTLKRLIKHSHCRNGKKTKTYRSWHSMVKRCTNPNDKDYLSYGGRGIKVCKRWMKFENFLEDIGEIPRGHQIDRIDNNQGYNKLNCHWVTSKTNCRNRRDNHLIVHDGKTQCLIEWAEEFDINAATLRSRIVKYKWSIEKALTTPARKKSVI